MSKKSNEEQTTQPTEASVFGRTAPTESKETSAMGTVGTIESQQLAADRARLQREEQDRIDKERQAELARQRELARFD